MATQEDVDKAKKEYNPVELDYIMKNDEKEKNIEEKKIPVLGKLLRKKLRAKKLMDQKATSVADVAMVLKLQQEEEIIPTTEVGERLREPANEDEEKPLSKNKQRLLREAEEKRTMSTIQRRAAERERRWQGASRTYRKRIRSIHEDEAAFQAIQEVRAEVARSGVRLPGHVALDKDAMHRIALGQDGWLKDRHGVVAYDPHEAALLLLNLAKPAAKDTTVSPGDIDNDASVDDLGPSEEAEITTLTIEALEPESQFTAAETKAGQKPILAAPNVASQVVKAARANTDTPSAVRILWANLDDSEFAEAWPETVEHQQLKPKTVIRNARGMPVSNSIHVIADNFAEKKAQLKKQERRLSRQRDEDMEKHEQLESLDRRFKANELYRAGLDIMLAVHSKVIEVGTESQSSVVSDDFIDEIWKEQNELQSELEKPKYNKPGC